MFVSRFGVFNFISEIELLVSHAQFEFAGGSHCLLIHFLILSFLKKC